jgi:hypothetical protein
MARVEWTNAHLTGDLQYMLDDEDPAPAVEQFNQRSAAGWRSRRSRWTNDGAGEAITSRTFSRNERLTPIARARLRDETILLYPMSWVLIEQPNGEWDIARMDSDGGPRFNS